MSPEEKLRLTHIAEPAALIGRYVEGISKREFLEDTLRQDAVIRRIQIIGEAVRHLSDELLSNMPDFPAKEEIMVSCYHGKERRVRGAVREACDARRVSP